LLARYASNAKYPDDTRIITDADSLINITIKGGNILLPSNGVQTSAATDDLHHSHVKLNGVTHVTLNDTARGYGFYSTGSNTGIQAAAGAITTHNANGHGIYSTARGSVEAANLVIASTGKTAHGVYATSSGSVTLRDSAINTTDPAAAGPYDYTVQNDAQLAATHTPGLTTADAANWYLARTNLSATADAIINTVAMLGRDWH
jgi:hypothetical protein